MDTRNTLMKIIMKNIYNKVCGLIKIKENSEINMYEVCMNKLSYLGCKSVILSIITYNCLGDLGMSNLKLMTISATLGTIVSVVDSITV